MVALAVFATSGGLFAMLVLGLWFSLRDKDKLRADSNGPDDVTTTTHREWHLVEEFLPPARDRSGRWLEVRRSPSRVDAEREWAKLTRASGHPRAYRIVTTTATAPAVHVPPPLVAPLSPVPLYERLVHHAMTDGVFAQLSQQLYARILGPKGTDAEQTGDPYLLPFFRNADGSLIERDRLERHMTHFLMAALGAPKRYTGGSMASAHADLHITDRAFDRVISHVKAVLHGMGMPDEWLVEIRAAMAPLRESIVTA